VIGLWLTGGVGTVLQLLRLTIINPISDRVRCCLVAGVSILTLMIESFGGSMMLAVSATETDVEFCEFHGHQSIPLQYYPPLAW
jgi:hypothetical protein